MRTKFGSQELDGGAADEIGREDIGEYLNLFFEWPGAPASPARLSRPLDLRPYNHGIEIALGMTGGGYSKPEIQRTSASSVRNLWVARKRVFLIVPSVVFRMPATVRNLIP